MKRRMNLGKLQGSQGNLEIQPTTEQQNTDVRAGKVNGFFTGRDFGFINADSDLPSGYRGRRVFFHQNRICGERPENGDEVYFILSPRKPEKPSVERLWGKQMGPTDPGPTISRGKSRGTGSDSTGRREREKYHGVVESADPVTSDWGYISATQPVPAEFEGKLLHFKQKDVRGHALKQGEKVLFSLVTGSDMVMPQANNIQRLLPTQITEQVPPELTDASNQRDVMGPGTSQDPTGVDGEKDGDWALAKKSKHGNNESKTGREKGTTETILQHRGRLVSIKEGLGHGYIKPYTSLPLGYAQDKDVFFLIKEVDASGFSLACGDEIEFTLGTKNKEKPRAMRPQLVKCRERNGEAIEAYLGHLLQEFQRNCELQEHGENVSDNNAPVTCCPAVWNLIGNCRSLSDDAIFMLLDVINVYCCDMKTQKANVRQILVHLSQTSFLDPDTSPLKSYLTRQASKMTDDIATSVKLFSVNMVKHIPTKSRAIVTILKPLVSCESGRFEMLLFQLLQQAVRASTDCVEDMDWDELPLVPGGEELLSGPLENTVNLRAVQVQGPYPSAEDYMDIYFRLLRTDCFSSLRSGIKDFLAGKLDHRDMNVYHRVQLAGIQTSNFDSGLTLAIHVVPMKQVKNWATASNLMFGNLLCLSPSGTFRDPIWATVVKRDVELLKKNGTVLIELATECNEKTDAEVVLLLGRRNLSIIMVESPTYYKAYEPVLSALQKQDPETLPFKRTLVQLEPPGPPSYLSSDHEGEQMDISSSDPYFSTYDTCKTLDPSQAKALNLAIRNNIGIIQGPPGTGKTFLGIKILEHILSQGEGRQGPILVLTYKNHALDEFLKHAISLFPDCVARIGGRSSEPELEKCNLNELKKEKKSKELGKQLYELRSEADGLKASLKKAGRALEDAMRFTPSNLLAHLDSDQVRALIVGMDMGKLKKGFTMASCSIGKKSAVARSAEIQRWIDEISANKRGKLKESMQDYDSNDVVINDLRNLYMEAYNQWMPSSDLFRDVERKYNNVSLLVFVTSDKTKERVDEGDERDVEEEEKERMSTFRGLDRSYKTEEIFAFKTENAEAEFRPGLFPCASKIFEQVSSGHLLNVEDIWTFSQTERVCLVQLILLHKSEDPMRVFQHNLQQYQSNCKSRSNLENIHKAEILRSKRIIGMTVTGASLNHDLLCQVRPGVVIVEEAGEVLEPHLVAALGNWARHLILIGDHEQLKPNVENYTLRKEYHLDVSLMERLIKNKIPYATLEMQNRMRPEFAELLLDIYPTLKSNLQRVKTNDAPPCVEKSMFFWDHRCPEIKSRSVTNEEEVERAIKLALFFIQQGYAPNKITILGAYKGQVALLRRKLKEAETKFPEYFASGPEDTGDKEEECKVVIHTIDNYQGDENDIVIVSLVRSEPSSKGIGFLNLRNRRCVAQSRARCGMYFIGNRETLLYSSYWSELLKRMAARDCVGKNLVLQCPRHPKSSKILASSEKEITLGAFCKEQCIKLMDCKIHHCKLTCQPNHRHTFCREKVSYTFPNCRHTTIKECYKDPGKLRCEQKIPHKFPICGHQTERFCFSNPAHMKCREQCPMKLKCGHPCDGICSDECNDDNCGVCARIRREEERKRRQAEELARERVRQQAKDALEQLRLRKPAQEFRITLESRG